MTPSSTDTKTAYACHIKHWFIKTCVVPRSPRATFHFGVCVKHRMLFSSITNWHCNKIIKDIGVSKQLLLQELLEQVFILVSTRNIECSFLFGNKSQEQWCLWIVWCLPWPWACLGYKSWGGHIYFEKNKKFLSKFFRLFPIHKPHPTLRSGSLHILNCDRGYFFEFVLDSK